MWVFEYGELVGDLMDESVHLPFLSLGWHIAIGLDSLDGVLRVARERPQHFCLLNEEGTECVREGSISDVILQTRRHGIPSFQAFPHHHSIRRLAHLHLGMALHDLRPFTDRV